MTPALLGRSMGGLNRGHRMVNGPAAPTAVQDDEPLPGFNELLDEYNHYSPIVRAKIKKLKAQLGKESVSLRDFDRADRLMAERFYAVRDKLQMMNKLPKQHRKAGGAVMNIMTHAQALRLH